MANIIRRTGKDGKSRFFVRIRRTGAKVAVATFTRMSDAKMWIHETEKSIRGHALQVLKEHSKLRRIDSDLLFPGDLTYQNNKPYNFKKPWAKAVKDAQLEDFVFHDLRTHARRISRWEALQHLRLPKYWDTRPSIWRSAIRIWRIVTPPK